MATDVTNESGIDAAGRRDPGQRPDAARAAEGTRAFEGIRHGTGEARRVRLALFLAGFATFSLIYCVQPLMPSFAGEFHLSAAASSLPLSLTTGFLAVSIFCAGAGSENLGRRGLMFVAMAAAAVLNMASAMAPDWHVLLVLRALEGVVLGGVPAVAMAYLAEEMEPGSLGLTMGLYVGGTAFGGMFGRVGMGFLLAFGDWRFAMGMLGAVDLAAAVGFILLLPRSRNFTRATSFSLRSHAGAWRGHLVRREMQLLFAVGGLVMGGFVSIYNYTDFRLSAAPYDLGPRAISLIFTAYMFGIVSSSVAGALTDRIGRGPVMFSGIVICVLGVLMTLAAPLPLVIGGIVVLTIGFFIAHSVASGWVGRLARGSKGHASSLYLLSYYVGSSVMGSLGGWFWAVGRWPAVAGFTLVLFALGLGAAGTLLRLSRRAGA